MRSLAFRQSSVLIMGDFNVDPLDRERMLYDRTDDILTMRGFERLCPSRGCAVPTYVGTTSTPSASAAAVDLAFFHGGGVWHVEATHIGLGSRRTSRAPALSDHRPIWVILAR